MTMIEIAIASFLITICGCILGGIMGWHVSKNRAEFQELHDAFVGLWDVIIKELRVKELADWLARRLKGGRP